MNMQIDYIPSDPDMKREWIKYQLKIRGLSLAKLARVHGVTRHAFSKALITGSIRWDFVIAEAIEYPVSVLWPERYGEEGLPLSVGGVAREY